MNMITSGEVPRGEYDIFLKINDPKEMSANKRCIQCANHTIWNISLCANVMGSTTGAQSIYLSKGAYIKLEVGL